MNIGVVENGRVMAIEMLEWEQSSRVNLKVQSKWLCGIKAG